MQQGQPCCIWAFCKTGKGKFGLEWINSQFAAFGESFYNNLIKDDRWKFIVEGLGNTLFIAAVAVMIGILIGVVVGIVRVSHTQTGKYKFANWLCGVYLTVIRGTPVVVQLMILYYIVFASAPLEMAIFVAMLSFGINSGAYVAEIIRAGILSIDRGQMEAGRSLGLSQGQTMRKIILPQAIKNILPALFNEFIVLLKETSVAGYVAIRDLTKAADIIRSRTFSPFFPLLTIALIYLIVVVGLTKVQKLIERRLSQSDNR